MEKTNQLSRKLQKKKLEQGMAMASIDRLSALPDAVLCHILSFLPTKRSVSTSVLAKRWRFLWADVPTLDFSDCYFRRTSFSDVITRVLLLHKRPTINTFLLYFDECRSDCSNYQFESWIVTLAARNVQNLDLCPRHQCPLPRCLFTCRTLVDLRLTWCAHIPKSGSINLPALKKLRLDEVDYESDESLPHLLSGCPVIEELIVDRTSDDMFCCRITWPTLIRLVVLYESCSETGDFGKSNRLKIDTPVLKYLHVVDSIVDDVSTGPLNSLIEADINFDYKALLEAENDSDYDELTGDNIPYSCSVIRFVARLCSAKSVRLSSIQMPVPDSAFSALAVKFHNLTKLELDADCRFLSYILENADNLEVLIVNQVGKDRVPSCISSHLRTVTIRQFRGTQNELELIKLILRNATVLKMMEIYARGLGINGAFGALKRISKFQRGSQACEVVFH